MSGVVAVIPARGGSRGIPRKNIAPLGGHPLLAYSIKAAEQCAAIDRIVVSTDDAEIAEVARRYGAETPCLRPAAMASDRATTSDGVLHMLEWLKRHEGYDTRVVVVMYPTYPFRRPELIDACVRPVAEGKASAAGTAVRVDFDALVGVDRADPAWMTTGSIQATVPVAYGWYHATRMIPVEDPIERIDIDLPEDLALAERVLSEGLWDGPRP